MYKAKNIKKMLHDSKQHQKLNLMSNSKLYCSRDFGLQPIMADGHL